MELDQAIRNVFGWTRQERREYLIRVKMTEIYLRVLQIELVPWDEED